LSKGEPPDDRAAAGSSTATVPVLVGTPTPAIAASQAQATSTPRESAATSDETKVEPRGRWVLKGYRERIAFSVHPDPIKEAISHQAVEVSAEEAHQRYQQRMGRARPRTDAPTTGIDVLTTNAFGAPSLTRVDTPVPSSGSRTESPA
jgi:hypothetical protein